MCDDVVQFVFEMCVLRYSPKYTHQSNRGVRLRELTESHLHTSGHTSLWDSFLGASVQCGFAQCELWRIGN
jgi:hypothetical protein